MAEPYRVFGGQVLVYHEKEDERRLPQYAEAWSLQTLPGSHEFGTIAVRIELPNPVVHLSPMAPDLAEEVVAELHRSLEQMIAHEAAWLRRWRILPPERRLQTGGTRSEGDSVAACLRRLDFDQLADYARFMTERPLREIPRLADRLRRAEIEPCAVYPVSEWRRRLPVHSTLYAELLQQQRGDGEGEVTLLELLRGDSQLLLEYMLLWPDLYGPRRRLLRWDGDTLDEETWDQLLGARVPGVLTLGVGDTLIRLEEHLAAALSGDRLAVVITLALLGFTLTDAKSTGPIPWNSRLATGAEWPKSVGDHEIEAAFQRAVNFIEAHSHSHHRHAL